MANAKSKGGNARPAPISAHPVFPVIVALWFAALLGFGSFVLPAPLLEKFVTVTHLDSLIAAAAPPLGFFARAILAIGAALLGAISGVLIARKVTGGSRAKPEQTRMAVRNATLREDRAAKNDAPRRPLSINDEVDGDALDGRNDRAMPVKRRALAMSEEQGPSELFQQVPFPNSSYDNVSVASTMQFDAPAFADEDASDATLDLDGAMEEISAQDQTTQDEPDASPIGPEATLTAAPQHQDDQFVAPEEVQAADAQRPFAQPGAAMPEPERAIRFSLSDEALRDHLRSTIAPDQEPPGEPPRFSLPNLDISDMVDHDDGPDAAADQMAPFAQAQGRPAFVEPAPGFCEPDSYDDDESEDERGDTFESLTSALKNSTPPTFIAPEFEDEDGMAEGDLSLSDFLATQAPQSIASSGEPADTAGQPDVEPLEERPLTQLGTAQLVERLARAMQQRGAADTAAFAAPQPPMDTSGQADEAPAVRSPESDSATASAPVAQPAPFTRPEPSPPVPYIPDALRPVAFDELPHGDDDDAIDLGAFSLPLKGGARQFAQPDAPFAASPAADATPVAEDPDELDEEEWELSEQDSYSSLLDMKTPFVQQPEFVRIEEPEPITTEVEPVVVFPGQEARGESTANIQAPTRAAPSTSDDEELKQGVQSSERPFAQPAAHKARAFSKRSALSAQTGTDPVATATASAAPAQRMAARHTDPAETERALRAALATLQKMSGAA
ncbi:MAG: hypothetical protein AB7G24_04775 [Novosphingobium sp.]